MCIAVPGQIVSFRPDRPDVADVLVEGFTYSVNLATLGDEPLASGDWILIHAGCALAKVTEAEAKDALDFMREINDAYEAEMAAALAAAEEGPSRARP